QIRALSDAGCLTWRQDSDLVVVHKIGNSCASWERTRSESRAHQCPCGVARAWRVGLRLTYTRTTTREDISSQKRTSSPKLTPCIQKPSPSNRCTGRKAPAGAAPPNGNSVGFTAGSICPPGRKTFDTHRRS